MITFLLFVSAVGHLRSYSEKIETCQEERIVGNFNEIALVFLEQGK